MATKKNIIDSVWGMLTRFRITDESKYDSDYLSYVIDKARADLIVKQFAQTGEIDNSWLQTLSTLTCYKVSYTDDKNVVNGKNIAKTTIPQVISLVGREGNIDLGLYAVNSVSNQYGASQFYPSTLFQMFYEPAEHTYSNFKWYYRQNTSLYLSDPNVTSINVLAILLHPEDGKLISSAPVASGSIASGTVYLVKYGQIVYDTVVYQENETFTGGAVATYTGNGTVYLNSQVSAYRDVDPYPASGDMIRQIELEILTKEFAIEKGQLTDVRNDSVDDANKTVSI